MESVCNIMLIPIACSSLIWWPMYVISIKMVLHTAFTMLVDLKELGVSLYQGIISQ